MVTEMANNNISAQDKDKIKRLTIREIEFVDKIVINPGELPVKQFNEQNSLLTDLLEIKHIRSVYNIFLAILLGLFLHTAAYESFFEKRTQLGLHLIITGFARLHYLILLWICMYLVQFLVYRSFKLWATVRTQLTPKSTELKLWDKLWISLLICYMLVFLYIFTLGIIKFQLPPAASFSLGCEIARFLMKAYAFVRSNAPRVLKYKLHVENQTLCPSLNQFVYYLWAPTLIYKDNYPRTKTINWGFVLKCVLEFFGCLWYLSFMYDKFIIPSYEDFGKTAFSWQYILVLTLANSLAAVTILLTAFYASLHAWMNGFAEVCRFGDRLFYKDWWTSNSYERYFRTWNVIVHDWLYTYVYKDFYEIVTPKNKIIAKNVVFFLSAIFHDYIMTLCLRCYCPILFILFFGAGLFTAFVRLGSFSMSNILFWYTFGFGMSVNCTFFALEYYCRLNQPIQDVTFWNNVYPALFNCYK